MRFETSIDIGTEPQQVWDALIDVERFPQWTESMTSVVRLDTGPFGAGSRARIEQPRLRPAIWEVTEFEPLVSFTWAATFSGIRTEGGHRLVSNADGSATITLSIVQTGALAWLVSALYGGLTRRYVGMEAQGLKQWCEAGGARDEVTG